MKLEEKRRQIEQEKRKMEVALNRQQQKVGKAAFLQAINKVIFINLDTHKINCIYTYMSKIFIIVEKTEF